MSPSRVRRSRTAAVILAKGSIGTPDLALNPSKLTVRLKPDTTTAMSVRPEGRTLPARHGPHRQDTVARGPEGPHYFVRLKPDTTAVTVRLKADTTTATTECGMWSVRLWCRLWSSRAE